MSIHFTQGKLKGQERKAVIQEIQQQLQEAALAVISSLLTLFLEEELKPSWDARKANHDE